MSFVDKVLDYPVLVQGALGSFLFLILYNLGKWLTNLTLKLVGKFSDRVSKEVKQGLVLHHAQSVFEGFPKQEVFLASILLAINRVIHAAIFALLGVACSSFIGPLSIVAYLIAIFYLYLALRAAHVEFGHPQSSDFHVQEIIRLGKELMPTISPEKSDKNV